MLTATYPSTPVTDMCLAWNGKTIDGALPFGLRSAPKIFNTVADVLEWILRQRGVKNVFYYLDDFIVLGHPHSTECLQGLKNTCKELHVGLPLAIEKCEGPSTRLTFLGIVIDTVRMELQLPLDKIERRRFCSIKCKIGGLQPGNYR